MLEISNEKTLKVIRIVYEKMLTQSPEEDKQNHTQAQGVTHIQKLLISHLGLSIVNQQARELCYISF